mmetsp:Transcript_124896/g.216562  ORF Transcript_124896/g.216562 Transcript_124896/m.216562 type:complete len:373 (+) Transcript_124896:250-1368(+)
MGNQMPARCMVPCNPVCCAMCFHSDAGREADHEHKTGSIFANAASVLSMAAEEISLDDHLEKELANEVELWRMETSSTAVHTNEGSYRTVFATVGRESHSSSVYDASSAVSSPDVTGRLEDLEDPVIHADKVGIARAQIADHMNDSSSSQRLRLKNVTAATRESTGLSAEHSETREREETAVSSSFGASGSQDPPTSPGQGKTKRGDMKKSPRADSNGAALAGSPGDHDAAGSAAADASKNSRPECSSPRSDGVPLATPAPQEVVRVQTNLNDASANSPIHGNSPVQEEQTMGNDLSSFSSSEEDSFPGFIEEDPVTRAIHDEGFEMNGFLRGDLNAQPIWQDMPRGDKQVTEPNAAEMYSYEGVQLDRDRF